MILCAPRYRSVTRRFSRSPEKLGAEFIPFEIYSEDKLLFVATELSKAGVPFVEEGTTLHIPDYAQKTAVAIAASYHPIKTEGVREKIKLDICSFNKNARK